MVEGAEIHAHVQIDQIMGLMVMVPDIFNRCFTHNLLLLWHPDRQPDTNANTQHIIFKLFGASPQAVHTATIHGITKIQTPILQTKIIGNDFFL